ncbi:MAG: 16S rRNA (uracil(1498)-N(3))-methyltransferase [Sedimentisphaerales bacterium]|nr:16S rRNA (uracil(1498)-N(3))-methyltransferase [Sedimentisphaerales bacterium]MBN2841622.1 16S rRNA (uracil(1498)-N(3))-methyltransferase [Sedimentisphaerales bacterium]
MNLIILQSQDNRRGDEYVISDERASHVLEILKAQVGDTLAVGLLNGPMGRATVRDISDNAVTLACEFEGQIRKATAGSVDVICALPRPQTLKKVLHSAAAMGVSNLYFIRSNRVEKSYFHSPMLQQENYQRFLIEGLSQGKSTLMPQVSFHQRFREFFEDYLPGERHNASAKKILFSTLGINNLLHCGLTANDDLILALGPEGGWVDFEEQLMVSSGFFPVKLGPWILRVENALVAALAQLELTR